MPSAAEDDVLTVTPLGAGAEVGRSCVIVRFKRKTIMFDCGVHPAYSGLAALPFFDEVDPSEIDLVLITHFHLDHCAGLPYLMTQTNFNPRGRVFMTHPTKAVYRTLIGDFVRVGSSDFAGIVYSDADLNQTMSRIECIDYHQQVDVAGVRIAAYNAGHVLGAAMFMVEVAGVRVLYTGDFSRQEDRHLMEAEVPPGAHPDVLISESTYGVQVHEPRRVREARFTQRVAEVVKRGGRCLLPVFALGRAQELLLILEEYWEAHPELQDIPIYYSSSIAKRCMAVYATYINQMNQHIQQRYLRHGNPFAFKYVSNIRSLESFDDAGPCVFMASPGMLQSGVSRRLFERWCTDRRNGVVLPGYSVSGTLAKYVLSGPAMVPRLDGQQVPLRCSVDYITFSAHSDFMQTSEFIDRCRPANVVLVHGESNEMQRLAHALDNRFNRREDVTTAVQSAARQVEGGAEVEALGEGVGEGGGGGGGEGTRRPLRIFTPKNIRSVYLEFRGEVTAKAIGTLAKQRPEAGTPVAGVLLRRDYKHTLMQAAELEVYTTVKTARVRQRLLVPLQVPGGYAALLQEVRGRFQHVEEEEEEEEAVRVGRLVRIAPRAPEGAEQPPSMVLEWEASYAADAVVDALVALAMARSAPEERDGSRSGLSQFHDDHRLLDVERRLLAERFHTVEVVTPTVSRMVLDLWEVRIDHDTGQVTCDDAPIKAQVELALRRIHAAVLPIPDGFCGDACC